MLHIVRMCRRAVVIVNLSGIVAFLTDEEARSQYSSSSSTASISTCAFIDSPVPLHSRTAWEWNADSLGLSGTVGHVGVLREGEGAVASICMYLRSSIKVTGSSRLVLSRVIPPHYRASALHFPSE